MFLLIMIHMCLLKALQPFIHSWAFTQQSPAPSQALSPSRRSSSSVEQTTTAGLTGKHWTHCHTMHGSVFFLIASQSCLSFVFSILAWHSYTIRQDRIHIPSCFLTELWTETGYVSPSGHLQLCYRDTKIGINLHVTHLRYSPKTQWNID